MKLKGKISEGKLVLMLDKIKTTLEFVLHQLEEPDLINIEAAEEAARSLLEELNDSFHLDDEDDSLY